MVALTKDQMEMIKSGPMERFESSQNTTKVPRTKNSASAGEVLQQLEKKIKDMQQKHETEVSGIRKKISTCDTEIAQLQSALIMQAQQ